MPVSPTTAPTERRPGPGAASSRRRPASGRVAGLVGLALVGALSAGCDSGGAAAGPFPSTATSPVVTSPPVTSPAVSTATTEPTRSVVPSATGGPAVTSAPTPTGSRTSRPTTTATPSPHPSASPSVPVTVTVTGTPTAGATAGSHLPADGVGGVLVASYGTGGTSSLGILGRGTPQQAWNSVAARAGAFAARGVTAAPAFELIVTVASAGPGRGGLYRSRIDSDVIDTYVRTAQANGGSVILDIQPGRSDFLTEAKALAPWLDQPGVGLALDPEWRMAPGEVPGRSIGSVDAGEVNEVSAWLDDLVSSHHLPDKVFLVHRFTTSMIRGDSRLADRPHLREIMNVDGFGTRAAKLSKYHAFAARSSWPMGLKLFTKSRNDPDLLQPADVLALKPRPVIVNYQ